MHSIKKERIYFQNLDAIRFILAMMVLFSHTMFSTTFDHLTDNEFLRKFIHGISSGSNAVSFFFVLSGFLITYLLLQEKENSETINIQKFYIRRVLRIWPVYYFVVIFGYWLYPISKSLVGLETHIPSKWWLDALFLGNYNSILVAKNNMIGTHPLMLNITWSVSIEEQFYLFWPILFLFNKNKIQYLIVIIIVGSLFFTYLNPSFWYYHTFSRILDLSIGGLFSYLCFTSQVFVGFFRNLSAWLIFVIYILGFSIYFNFIDFSFGLPSINRILNCSFYAFIICEQNFSNNSVWKFKNWKFGTNQGKYTYGLYMLHTIGIQVAVIIYKLLKIDNSTSFLYGIVYILISIVCGYLLAFFSYHYFEKYFLNIKNKFTV